VGDPQERQGQQRPDQHHAGHGEHLDRDRPARQQQVDQARELQDVGQFERALEHDRVQLDCRSQQRQQPQPEAGQPGAGAPEARGSPEQHEGQQHHQVHGRLPHLPEPDLEIAVPRQHRRGMQQQQGEEQGRRRSDPGLHRGTSRRSPTHRR
jgi:hypothetical protein